MANSGCWILQSCSSESEVDKVQPPTLVIDLKVASLVFVRLIENIRSGECVECPTQIFGNAEMQIFVKELTEALYDHVHRAGALKPSPASENSSFSNVFIEAMKCLIEELSSVDYLYFATKFTVKDVIRSLVVEYLAEAQTPEIDTDIKEVPVPASSMSRHRDQLESTNLIDSNIESSIRGTEPCLDEADFTAADGKGSDTPGLIAGHRHGTNSAANIASALIARLVKKASKVPGQKLTMKLESLNSRIVDEVNTSYSDVQLRGEELDKFVNETTAALYGIYGGASRKMAAAMNGDEQFCDNVVVCLKLQFALHAGGKTRSTVFRRMLKPLRRAAKYALDQLSVDVEA